MGLLRGWIITNGKQYIEKMLCAHKLEFPLELITLLTPHSKESESVELAFA